METPYFALSPLPGALQGVGLGDALASAAGWVGRGTYRTAWAVPSMSVCQCSYSYGHGPAIGPHTGQQTFRMLSGVWRALAHLMSPWCPDGDVPTAANLNLYEGQRAHVAWHCR